MRSLVRGWAQVPLNAAFLARGSSRSAALLEQAVVYGAGGFKVHEDWGATPEQVDTCLGVAEAWGLPVALHTDTLNESGYLADTIAATAGRTVHAYHVEGGGGHPDVLSILNWPHVLGSSTTPTLPLTVATVGRVAADDDDGAQAAPAGAQRRRGGPLAGAAARRSRPRTCCTTWARSPSSTPTRWAWAGSARWPGGPGSSRTCRPTLAGEFGPGSRTTPGYCATWPS